MEFLPSDVECAEREAVGQGLSSPELSVLLAYVKIGLTEDVLHSELPDDPWCTELLVNYFPSALRTKFRSYMDEHRLRREIVATLIVNDAVNRGGTTFVYRAMEETGASAVDVLRAYMVVCQVLGLRQMWAETSMLDNKISD